MKSTERDTAAHEAAHAVVAQVAGLVVRGVDVAPRTAHQGLCYTEYPDHSWPVRTRLGAYAATPGWLSGLFLLLPEIGGLLAALGAFYGLYLLYLGLPILMRSDPDRTGVYFVATLAMAVVLGIVIGALTSCMGNYGGPISL